MPFQENTRKTQGDALAFLKGINATNSFASAWRLIGKLKSSKLADLSQANRYFTLSFFLFRFFMLAILEQKRNIITTLMINLYNTLTKLNDQEESHCKLCNIIKINTDN